MCACGTLRLLSNQLFICVYQILMNFYWIVVRWIFLLAYNSLSLSWASSTFRLLNIYSSWDLFIVCVCHCVFNAHVVHFRFAAEQFHCLYFVFSWSTWSQSCKSNIVLCIYRHVRWRSLSRYCVFVCIVKQDTRIRRNKTANQPTEQK